MSNSNTLLVIGLDGATWDVMLPLCRQGLLPHVSRLMETGAWQAMRSTAPPITYPAWTTLMTGTNPGKHGIFDFTERVPGSGSVRFVNATFRRQEAVWQALSRAGLRVGIMGVPVTYPPEPVNGFMVSGFDSPVSRRIEPSFVYPRELFKELTRRAGGDVISDVLETFMDESWYERSLSALLDDVRKKAETALYLFRKEPWDCFMVVFGATDTVAHHYWKFYDPRSPRFQKSAALSKAVAQVYQQIDAIIGAFLSACEKDAAVMLVSDHGFGGVGTAGLSLNRRLEEAGLLRLGGYNASAGRLVRYVREAVLRYAPHAVLEKLFRSPLLHLVQRVEGRSRSGGIVWPHTTAFSEELNHFPAVYINVRGREPYGTVSPGMEYESVRDAVIGHMHDWHDPDTGAPVVRSAWRREQLYEGAQVGRAPDIILELNEDCGYSYMCLPYTRFQEHETVKRFPRDMLTGNRQMSMSGSHRLEGIFLVSGSRTRRAGKLPHQVDIQDICPTVLSFFGIPVPDYIDGRAIPVFCGQQIQAGAGREEQVDGGAHETPYTREQEKKIARRLRNLGYID